MKILDLGCGKNKYESLNEMDEVIGLDKIKITDADVIHDLENLPLPFDDNEFDEIIASHVLEHLDNFWEIMNELYRVLKPDNRLKIWVPYFSSHWTFAPDHKHYFSGDKMAFACFTFASYFGGFREDYYTKARFNVEKMRLKFDIPFLGKIITKLVNTNLRIYERFFPWILPADELYVELRSLKKIL